MGLFDGLTVVQKAKAALEQARKDEEAARAQAVAAEMQKGIDAVNEAAAAQKRWSEQQTLMQEALEHAGISGVEVAIDGAGFARLSGTVTSEADRDTASALAEELQVTGLEVAIEIVEAPAEEALSVSGDAPTAYTVKAGESWWGIAQRAYGAGGLWKALKAANGNPKMLHPGAVITLPPKSALKA